MGWWRLIAGCTCACLACVATHARGGSTPSDHGAAERDRLALLQHSYLKTEWQIDAYRNAGKHWGTPAPDPDRDPEGYARAFALYYGLHPAPYPNEGLPMGLRWSRKPDGTTTGIQVDCMACHGGSIGGKSYVGLGNTQVDYDLLFGDLFRADGRRVPLVPFTINTARGTTNAGMMAVVLLSVRNPDLSRRKFPLRPGQPRPHFRRQAVRGSEDGVDRVSESAVSQCYSPPRFRTRTRRSRMGSIYLFFRLDVINIRRRALA